MARSSLADRLKLLFELNAADYSSPLLSSPSPPPLSSSVPVVIPLDQLEETFELSDSEDVNAKKPKSPSMKVKVEVIAIDHDENAADKDVDDGDDSNVNASTGDLDDTIVLSDDTDDDNLLSSGETDKPTTPIRVARAAGGVTTDGLLLFPTSPIISSPTSMTRAAEECLDIIRKNQCDVKFMSDALRMLRTLGQGKSHPLPGSFSPSLKVCSWNTLKLSILGREACFQDALLHELSLCDIICLQEVPHSEKGNGKESSVEIFKSKLNARKNIVFKSCLSSPSGKGDNEKKEVHAIFYGNSWTLVSHYTMTNFGAVSFDYAPFVCKFTNAQFPGFVFFFSSVHFPPEGRKRDQDLQLINFEKAYESCVRDHFSEAFTAKGASDAKKAVPVHIVMGDFNAVPHFASFWNAWGDNMDSVRTSSGGRSFDHFYLSTDTRELFDTEANVRHLNFGPQQLSDHSPVFLHMTKQPKRSSKKSA
jgi:endonuclease/exonuclease/phosphatase family metal-dependent hydrolase